MEDDDPNLSLDPASPTDSDTNRETTPQTSKFWLLAFCVICVWLFSEVILYLSAPDWITRSNIGDSFGAIASLFSGLALAGVIYALLLQRAELFLQRQELSNNRLVLERQLEEMRSARELQSQPLAMPCVTNIRIERPRLYYAPPQDHHSALSRYFLKVYLSNPTNYPSIGVNISCAIAGMLGATDFTLNSASGFVEVLAPTTTNDTLPLADEFMFPTDEDALLFGALRQPDPRLVPQIAIRVLYKNIVGGHFRIVHFFRVFENTQVSKTLRRWHLAVAGFKTDFSRELAELQRQKREDPASWQESFDRVKAEFDRKLGKEEQWLELEAEPVPGVVSIGYVSRQTYEQELKKAFYPQRIQPGLYNCPVELDSRKERSDKPQ
jgi:hypothetical protein